VILFTRRESGVTWTATPGDVTAILLTPPGKRRDMNGYPGDVTAILLTPRESGVT